MRPSSSLSPLREEAWARSGKEWTHIAFRGPALWMSWMLSAMKRMPSRDLLPGTLASAKTRV